MSLLATPLIEFANVINVALWRMGDCLISGGCGWSYDSANNLHDVCVCSYDLLPSTTFCLPPMFHTESAPPTNAFIDGV